MPEHTLCGGHREWKICRRSRVGGSQPPSLGPCVGLGAFARGCDPHSAEPERRRASAGTGPCLQRTWWEKRERGLDVRGAWTAWPIPPMQMAAPCAKQRLAGRAPSTWVRLFVLKHAAVEGAEETSHLLSVIGGPTFFLARVDDSGSGAKVQSSPLSRRKDNAFVAHCWISSGAHPAPLLAACTAAQLQVISPEGELLHCIGLGPAFRATCIAAHAGEGLVVGSSATGPAFLALDDTGAPTQLERQEQGAVAAMCCLRTGAAALFGSGKVEVWRVAGGSVERRARLCPPRHAGAVRKVCTCLRRPIVVSAAADQCVRLWDAAACGLVLEEHFGEDIMSLALHPAGHMILVGLSSRLRLMTVLEKGFSPVKDLPVRACQACAFSHAGAMLAAANGQLVMIYDTWTCQLITILRAHVGRVEGLTWHRHDVKLWSVGADGGVYEWSVSEGTRVCESVMRGVPLSSLALPPDEKPAGASASDRQPAAPLLAEEWPKAAVLTAEGQLLLMQSRTAGVLTQMALPSHTTVAGLESLGVLAASQHGGLGMVYAGTAGGVASVPWSALLGAEGWSSAQVAQAGPMPVTALALLADESMLVAGMADGALAFFAVMDREADTSRRTELLPWANEVLVGREELSSLRGTVEELQDQVKGITGQHDYQLHVREVEAAEKLAALRAEHAAELQAGLDKLTAAEAAAVEARSLVALTEERLEAQHKKEMAAQHVAHAALLRNSQQKMEETRSSMHASAESWRAQVSGLEREYAAAIQACRAEAEAATERATQEAAATQARAASEIAALLARASEAEARAGGALLAAEAAADARYSSLAQQLDQMKGEAGAASLHAGLAQRERAGLAAALRREQERSKSLEASLEQQFQAQEAAQAHLVTRARELIARQGKLEATRAQIRDLEAKLESAIIERDAANDKGNAKADALCAAEKAVQGLKEELAAADASLGEARRAADMGRARVKLMQQELDRARYAAANLQAALRAIQLDVEAAAKMTGKEGVAALCRLYQTHVLTKASQAQVMSLPSSGEEVCLYPNDVAAASHVTSTPNDALLREQALHRQVKSLQGQLQAQQRSAASARQKMVADNLELLAQLRGCEIGVVHQL
ncbi:FAP57 [Auxenochlorella protothecoides x Auxenochlorella symbiontica]